MKKEIFKNLLTGNLNVTSEHVSPQEKQKIYSIMASKGMSNGTCYNRFFDDGFDQWEIIGIKEAIKAFAFSNGIYVDISNDANYYDFYKSLEKKTPFKEYMSSLGMCATTVVSRFKGFNFKPWELEGMESIILNNLIDE